MSITDTAAPYALKGSPKWLQIAVIADLLQALDPKRDLDLSLRNSPRW